MEPRMVTSPVIAADIRAMGAGKALPPVRGESVRRDRGRTPQALMKVYHGSVPWQFFWDERFPVRGDLRRGRVEPRSVGMVPGDPGPRAGPQPVRLFPRAVSA